MTGSNSEQSGSADLIEFAARLNAMQFVLEQVLANALLPHTEQQADEFLDGLIARSRHATADPTAPIRGSGDIDLAIARRTTEVVSRLSMAVKTLRQQIAARTIRAADPRQ